jgi:hypothetical protein
MPEQAGAMHERARPRVSQFAYPVIPRNLRYVGGPESEDEILWTRQLHCVRDASAFVELLETFINAGWTMGEIILNLPKEIPRPTRGTVQPATVETAPVDEAPAPTEDLGLTESDLIVLTTRVPLDDEKETGHQRIFRSHTPLEDSVFYTARQCFLEWCTRAQITLAWPLRELRHHLGLLEGNFQINKRTGATMPGEKNLGFLFYAPHLISPNDPNKKHPPGPKLLACFAPAGMENWLWARALRRLHKELLSQIISSDMYWCVVGTWDPMDSIPPRPPTLAFADGVRPALEVAWSEAAYEKDARWERLLRRSNGSGASPENGAWQVAPSR